MLIPFPKHGNRLVTSYLDSFHKKALSTVIFPWIAEGHTHASLTGEQHQ